MYYQWDRKRVGRSVRFEEIQGKIKEFLNQDSLNKDRQEWIILREA